VILPEKNVLEGLQMRVRQAFLQKPFDIEDLIRLVHHGTRAVAA
jgi:hypothetical protein